jgi:LPS sulfotransferase NodH
MRITSSFFICATPRSGSSLLSEALEFTSIAGRPREYFEPQYESDWFARLGIKDETECMEKFLAAGATSNGVFGAKVHWHQFGYLRDKLGLARGAFNGDLENLAQTFPGVKFIYLTRRDKVLQAISYVKAIQTDVWHSLPLGVTGTDATRPPPPAPIFDAKEIARWVARFTEDERRWQRYFDIAGIEPYEVVYEDFLESYDSTVRSILQYLGAANTHALNVVAPRLQKLGDETSYDWAGRYRALKRAPQPIRRTPRLSYFISTAPRTGGFLLAEALESTGIAGRPREYFDRAFQRDWHAKLAIESDADSFEKIFAAGTTPNSVFGAKVLWHQFEQLLAQLRLLQGTGLPHIERLNRVFPNLRYVLLTRRDKVRQAISYDRAIRSGVWWSVASPTETQESASPPEFVFENIDNWVTRLTEFDACWRRLFKRIGVSALELCYEDLADNCESSVRAVLQHLELPQWDVCPIAPPRLRIQSDAITEDWLERYRQIRQESSAQLARPVDAGSMDTCVPISTI